MTPILIGDCDSPGTASAASVTRTRASSTIERLPIECLLRDQGCASENSARFDSRKARRESRTRLTTNRRPAAPETAGFSGEPDGSRALAQNDVHRALARDVLPAFVAHPTHVDIVQERLPGAEQD